MEKKKFTLPSSNCSKNCGDVQIEYPFGIGSDCSYAAGFNLICVNDSNPPRLLLGNGTVQLRNFDMETSRIYIESPYVTLNADGQSNITLINLKNLPFSLRHDNLYVAGCNVTANIIDVVTNGTEGACSAICSATNTSIIPFDNGYCILHWNYMKFNQNLWAIHLTKLNKNSTTGTIAFMHDEHIDYDAFKRFIEDRNTTGMMASLTWYINDYSTCEEAIRRNNTYACRSNKSKCYNVSQQYPEAIIFYSSEIIRSSYSSEIIGYKCRCSSHYVGNPYLPDGCQLDIDECNSSTKVCTGICVNSAGNFSCICPLGTSGDPYRGECIKTTNQFDAGVILGASIGTSLLLFCVIMVIVCKKWKQRKQQKIRKRNFLRNHHLLLQQLSSTSDHVEERTNVFSLEEIEKATNNFDETRVLGKGGHGTVYKGILSDQRVVAIKKSKIIKTSEIDQFINEVAILSQINHRNVVKLLGCCLETEVPLLVYEFISNGTLSDHLHVPQGESKLSWDDRLRIATESAGALAYLHSAASMSVFHRDVKSSNILIDETFKAKVSDFGASKFIPLDQTHIVTAIHGTFGYIDPEYYQTSRLTEKSDVYSFGIILLELLVGKKPIYSTENGLQQNLAMNFLQAIRENTLLDLVEDCVLQEGTKQEVLEISSLIEICLNLKGAKRPTMKEVEYKLQSMRKVRMKKKGVRILEGNEDAECLLSVSSHSSSQMVDEISQGNSRNYSFEKELMWSQNCPR
ncbi:wall-associated receptor kinase-like 8 [Zingiber officinale]|uniref:wall-associated receptor kinase-like 8 n=1 Tax=Zingiber officinale TaxID=94328 RepID=UPI001C4D0059|nr:wall-associated receptor kinase-like 8 [Zingiber officinale]